MPRALSGGAEETLRKPQELVHPGKHDDEGEADAFDPEDYVRVALVAAWHASPLLTTEGANGNVGHCRAGRSNFSSHQVRFAIAVTRPTLLLVNEKTIDPGVQIGHVHLKVAEIERSLGFYCGVLGFELTQRYGTQAAFISAGGYHHHIGLNTWESAGGKPPPPGTTGLYHLAVLYPTRAALADALQRLIDAKIPLDGASDHGVSEALYLRDPDDNGVELYRDRPREEWPRTADGELAMFTRALDLQGLLNARA